MMPLLLLDLDNTLVDRTAAFLKWAERFAVAHGGDVDWLVEADADGYEPRARLAERIRSKYFLDDSAFSSLQADLDSGMADDLVLDPAVPMALTRAKNAGWVPVVVTNGRVVQQERKLSVTGLNRLVEAWVISEAVGVKKPDPEIFGAVARRTGRSLDGAWMIGDSATLTSEGLITSRSTVSGCTEVGPGLKTGTSQRSSPTTALRRSIMLSTRVFR